MHPLIQDIRFTFRLMRKRPGMTFLVIAALVLGIGLNTAVFGVLNAVLLRPLPLYEPERVVRLFGVLNRTGATMGTSYPDLLDWKSQNHSFEQLAAMRSLSFTLTGNGSPEHVHGFGISASGFRAWGVSPILGRDFTEEDDRPGSNRVVILNYEFWQRKFGGDRGVLGRTLILDGQQYTIAGVLQSTQVNVLRYPDLWITNGPMVNERVMERDARYFFPVARLRPNVTLVQATAEMETIAARLAAQYPKTNKDMGISLVSQAEFLTADGKKPVLLLMVASSLIFLLATVNVVTVFHGNTVERGQELSLRLALGASRLTLLRQLLIQSIIFAVLGAALGLVLAKTGLAYFLHRFPDASQRFHETTMDLRVIVVALGMALLVSLLGAVAPALYVLKLKVNTELKGEWGWFPFSRRRAFARGALIVVEVALAAGLSLVSGLLIKSLYAVENIDLGFNPHHIFSFQINLPPTRYKEPSKQVEFYELAWEKLRHLPGMESISAISGLPLTSQGEVNTLEVDGQSPLHDEKLVVEDESVLPGFFQTMGLPLLQGRDFTAADRESAPSVTIVDDALAAKLWPNQNPLGKRVRMTGLRNQNWHWLEVIGVVREIKHFGGPEAKVRWMQLYVPQYQDPTPMLSFVVNTSIAEGSLKTEAEKAIHDLDGNLPVDNFETMDAYLDVFLSGRKVGMLLLTGFAGIGMVLGMIGIYGVVANSVTQRRREVAIRMAVGATPSGTVVLITRLGLLSTLAGIVIGSGIVMSLARILSSLLYGVSALDPAVYILSAVVIILLAVTASLVPAVRLFRFNIQEILRQ